MGYWHRGTGSQPGPACQLRINCLWITVPSLPLLGPAAQVAAGIGTTNSLLVLGQIAELARDNRTHSSGKAKHLDRFGASHAVEKFANPGLTAGVDLTRDASTQCLDEARRDGDGSAHCSLLFFACCGIAQI